MSRSVIMVKKDIWVKSLELRPAWVRLTPEEVDSALDMISITAEDNEQSTDEYDNYNLAMMTFEDRRFKQFAREVEGEK